MLNRIIALTKVFLKLNFASYQMKVGGKGKGMIFLYIFLFGYLGFLSIFLSGFLVSALLEVHQATYFIGLVLMANIFMSLFEMILASINVLYFAKDNEAILPLPFKPFEIVTAKLNTLFVMNYLTEIFFGFIPFIVYGVLVGPAIWFYPIAFCVLMIIPIVPSLLAVFIVMIVMSFSKMTKNKSFFHIFSIFLSLGFALFISTLSSSGVNMSESQVIEMILKADAMVQVLKTCFPTLGFAITALVSTNLLEALLSLTALALMTMVAYLVIAYISQNIYFKGMIGCLYSSSSSSKKAINLKKDVKTNKVYKTYLYKEIVTLFRRPIFFTQCVLPALILPIFMALIFYVSINSSAGASEMAMILQFAKMEEFANIVFAVMLGYFFFSTMYVFISITGVSRDGEGAYFMKYIPIPFYKQVLYKALIDTIFVLVVATIITVFAFILALPIKTILLFIMVSIPYAFVHGVLMILVDLKKPKIHWANEYQVVKTNFSIFWVIVFSVVNIMSLIILFVFKMEYQIFGLLLFVTYAIISLILYNYMRKKDFELANQIV